MFDFLQRNHGRPDQKYLRHVGDLGNIVTERSGLTIVSILDNAITLEPDVPNSITNRAIVVHADEDDLGLGNYENMRFDNEKNVNYLLIFTGRNQETLETGNAGKRLACGIVEPLNF